MATLYLRNVPEDVKRGLETLASREGISVSSVAIRELALVARRADNPALLGDLPDVGIEATTVLEDLAAGRSGA